MSEGDDRRPRGSADLVVIPQSSGETFSALPVYGGPRYSSDIIIPVRRRDSGDAAGGDEDEEDDEDDPYVEDVLRDRITREEFTHNVREINEAGEVSSSTLRLSAVCCLCTLGASWWLAARVEKRKARERVDAVLEQINKEARFRGILWKLMHNADESWIEVRLSRTELLSEGIFKEGGE